MRQFCFLVVVLVAPGLFVGQGEKGSGLPDAPKKDPVAQDLKALEGTWLVVKHERFGKKAKKPSDPDYDPNVDFNTYEKIVIADRKMRFSGDAVPFEIDPTKSPKAINLHLPVSQMPERIHYRGIYSLNKDELKLCFSLSLIGERPTEFRSDTFELFVLKRKK
jgi:uncharacterized protein (TIGR03067 family)